jgi:hypothetical protein
VIPESMSFGKVKDSVSLANIVEIVVILAAVVLAIRFFMKRA